MKTCTRCQQELPEADFHWRNKAKGRRISRCRRCAAEWSKNHYRLNKPMYLEKAKRSNARKQQEFLANLLTYLVDHPCQDCGETDPVVLQFDHRSDKQNNVSTLMQRAWDWAVVAAEIAKCDVRCANCHARKTARTFGWAKLAGDARLVEHLHGKQD